MNFNIKVDSILLAIIVLLCLMVIYNVIRKLSVSLPYRVNCWSCNHNYWVKFRDRNSWTCPGCDQYNGFTKEGDYNKPLTAEIANVPYKSYTTRASWSLPSWNGLCYKCNNDLQIKIAQLASFVPMNEKKYDEEVEAYNEHLEKSYTLCKPCQRVLQKKMHREKEVLLGAKVVQSRMQDKKLCAKKHKFETLCNIMDYVSVNIERVLLLLIVTETVKALWSYEMTQNTISYSKEVLYTLLERMLSIAKIKILTTFPMLEDYSNTIYDMFNLSYDGGIYVNNEYVVVSNNMAQKCLAGAGCALQILGHLVEMHVLKYAVIFDVMWLLLCVMQFNVPLNGLMINFVKVICILSIFYINRRVKMASSPNTPKVNNLPKRMKNLTNGSISSHDCSSEDSGDDVSLTKLGVNTSSTSEGSPFNNTFMSGRVSITPNMWNKTFNSTFNRNSPFKNSPIVQNNLKQSLQTYQKLCKDDSDSDLDDSISCLNIGSRKSTSNTNPMFALRRFTPMPFLTPTVAPVSVSRPRPIIMPSKLGHSTSWVAGGYWGDDGGRQMFNVNGSRSSSQSSGFESQSSGGTVQNLFSQPPSREESICGDPDRTLLARSFSSFSVNSPTNMVFQGPQNFNNLIYPKMNSNNYIHIPQTRYTNVPNQNVFNENAYLQNNAMEIDPWMFKTPKQSGLLKPQTNLPRVNRH